MISPCIGFVQSSSSISFGLLLNVFVSMRSGYPGRALTEPVNKQLERVVRKQALTFKISRAIANQQIKRALCVEMRLQI